MDLSKKILNYYALTITPPYSVNSIRYDYYNHHKILKRYLNLCSSHYILYPEITTSGRLHYHAVIHLDDKIKWFKKSKNALKRIGFVKLDPILTQLDHIRWLVYIRKEWPTTSGVIGLEQPMIYKKGTYFSEIKDIEKKNDLLDYGYEIL